MKIKPLHTESDYKAALTELGAFFDRNPDTASQDEQDYFEVLATLVEHYEAKHHAITPPDPIAAIQFKIK